jgi:hypothetical protein
MMRDRVTQRLAVNAYVQLQISGASSLDLVIGVLEFCLRSAEERDRDKTLKGLGILEEGLDFRGSPELARVFGRIYRHCQHLVSDNRFEETSNYLRVLCDAWTEAKHRRKPHL